MRYCPCGIENDSFSEYPPEKDEHGQMKEVPDEEQLARQDKEIEGLKMTRRYCQIPEELKQSYLAFARRRMLAVLDRDRWVDAGQEPELEPVSSVRGGRLRLMLVSYESQSRIAEGQVL
jgi:hypothetical protein